MNSSPSNRLDILIVWPHGIEHIDEILSMLRKFDGLELLYFKRYTPPVIHDFIDMVYSVDPFPAAHLRAKNKHLYALEGNEVYILLIKNNKPDEKKVGEGEYEHLQCSYINDFKWKVRVKFNPYDGDEMTHQHMLHATDYEQQTLDIWKNLIDVPAISDLCARNTYFNYLPYYLSNFIKGFKVCRVPVNKLLCSEARDDYNRRIPLQESVFYKYVCGDQQPYKDYWNYFKGRRLEFDNTPSKFDEMMNNFEYQNLIVSMPDGLIVDGNHRAAIYLARNPQELITTIQIEKVC